MKQTHFPILKEKVNILGLYLKRPFQYVEKELDAYADLYQSMNRTEDTIKREEIE